MFKGVITPVVTPLNQNGRIDFKGVESMIEHLIAGGMNGILLLGSIGEFFAFSDREKKELISFAVEKTKKRIPVLIGTGGTAVEEVIGLTQFSEKAGADAAVVISPYYFNLSENDLYRYYERVAQSVAMPILLYNFPDRTAVNMSPQLVEKIAAEIPNIAGIKDTVDNISHTRQLIQTVKRGRPDFSILSGFDEYLLPNLMAGGDGVICGLTNIVPELFSALLADYAGGNFDAVKTAQSRISALMKIYAVSQPFVGAIKGAVSLRGLGFDPYVKLPSSEIDENQKNKIRAILIEAGISV